MVKYKRIDTANGRTQYWLGGKMVSPKNIPQEVLNDLQAPGEVEVPDNDIETSSDPTDAPTKRICLFCGKPGSFSKFINGVTVYLCEDDWRGHTTGEVAEQMRKNQLI